MRPFRYSINVTLDGCCDHRAMFADEELHRHAAENLAQADALLFGRVTYEMTAKTHHRQCCSRSPNQRPPMLATGYDIVGTLPRLGDR